MIVQKIAHIVNQALGKAISSNTCYRIRSETDRYFADRDRQHTGFACTARSGASVGIDDMVIGENTKSSRATVQIRTVPVWS